MCHRTDPELLLHAGSNSSLSRFITHCLKCCFWCLEKSIRYVNHNAYIMVSCHYCIVNHSYNWSSCQLVLIAGFLLSSASSPLDGDLRKELLRLSQSRFLSPHEERSQVRVCARTGHFISYVSIFFFLFFF